MFCLIFPTELIANCAIDHEMHSHEYTQYGWIETGIPCIIGVKAYVDIQNKNVRVK